ncbi:hypothetical protein PR003_g18794 [Phytophthora rubi]|uniref:Uncharacterized protein n=1 Tax=Phytophthora rubi TaxID=129364 RepID=A0A6A4E131_9STRA|nr:hypothetical protein PR002_g19008 [Phytophthora rubi]KAE9009477.1 hypothetical protein PR001_g16439 [Phytophthora rubi]KAE9316184.1 hypothetical protein PR003_g18794 [Phytophthora rubi]
MVDIVDSKVEAKLSFHKRLITERIDLNCTAISARAPVTVFFAFPDGTKIPICRPSLQWAQADSLHHIPRSYSS